jgi:ERCC4-related helicase
LRQQQVALLQRLRDGNALALGEANRGLQNLLRRYLLRNTKRQNERRYFLVERRTEGFECGEFRKLDDDLQDRVRRSPLIPFEGEHALFYLELRQLIEEVTEEARVGEGTRTFIPTDLRQGLSSYRQISASQLLGRDLDSARRLRRLVERWNASGALHPKVAALATLVRKITQVEIRKVRETTGSWFSKVLIFNKLIRGTAPQLTEVLGEVVRETFEEYLTQLLAPTGSSREAVGKKARNAVDRLLDAAEQSMRSDPRYAAWQHVPEEFDDEDFVSYRGRALLKVFREPLRRRVAQTLALVDLVRAVPSLDDESVEAWVDREMAAPVISAVQAVIDRYLDDTPHEDESRETLLERAQRELVAVLEETKSVSLVGRFDGENARDREAHRRNFNRRYNPFVLLVGQVGEEGIDLQEQCRYVIHYDLEWNPARMEQREGRVDRLNWGRQSEGFIDVRFLLLDGTYEERIFHTVMQRDQWFQILIGSKKRELGQLPEEADVEVAQDRFAESERGGGLTESEKARVMLDLRPEHP